MQLKIRRIGNSRGVTFPKYVAARLSRHGVDGEDLVEDEAGSRSLELTLIGQTAVLTPSGPDELELRAALAYAIVKSRRRPLLEGLALHDRAAPGSRLQFPSPFQQAPKSGHSKAGDEVGEQ